MRLSTTSLEALGQAYPHRPVQFEFELDKPKLLERDKIAELAMELPPQSIEQNMGNLAKVSDPSAAKPTGLTAAESVRTISNNGAWIVLKNIEQSDSYSNIVNAMIEQISAITTPEARIQKRLQEGFIFVSSPGSVTPYHIDHEHNILFQIEGTKRVTIYPKEPPFLLPVELERLHCGGHRNLPDREGIESGGEEFVLTPGTALYFPVTAPHWVQNGDQVSVSLSITWRSNLQKRERHHHLMNAWRRERGKPVLEESATLQRVAHTLLRKAHLR
jgi:hypothetical protein